MTTFLDGWLQNESAERDQIKVKRVYIDINQGNIIDGIMFSQIMYWHSPKRTGESRLTVERDGHHWLAKAYEDWWSEVRVNARAARESIKRMKDRGLIIAKVYRFGAKPIVHLRVDADAFKAALEHVHSDKIRQNELTKSVKTEVTKSVKTETSDSVRTYITETTAEITKAETTDKTTTTTPSLFEQSLDPAVSGGGGDSSLSEIEQILFDAGVNAPSWKFAKGWNADEVRALVEKVEGRAALIVTQLQMGETARRVIQAYMQDRQQKAADRDALFDHLTADVEERISQTPPPTPSPLQLNGWLGEGMHPNDAWAATLNTASIQMHPVTYKQYLAAAELTLYQEDDAPVFVVALKNDRALHYVSRRYHSVLAPILARTFRRAVDLRFVVTGTNPAKAEQLIIVGHNPITVTALDDYEELPQRTIPERPAEAEYSEPSEPPDPEIVWDKVCRAMQFRDMRPGDYDLFIKPTHFLQAENRTIYIKTSPHVRRRLVDRYWEKLKKRVDEQGRGHWRLELVTETELAEVEA